MNKKDHETCKEAIAEIRRTIPERLAELDEQFVEVLESEGQCKSTRLYTEGVTDLIFDVMNHAISYTDSANGLELLKERLQGAIDTLDVVIEVWDQSHLIGADWHRQSEEVLHQLQ
jgi:hypothetical protein